MKTTLLILSGISALTVMGLATQNNTPTQNLIAPVPQAIEVKSAAIETSATPAVKEAVVENEMVKSETKTVKVENEISTINESENPELESKCNPNYSGCLKQNAGDYDCAKGSGNGPNYTGRVTVLGYDEFDLDRDGDGVGCE